MIDNDSAKTFLILGGTGKVGRRLAELIRDRGLTARIASRSSGDVAFDWNTPATFTAAVEGASGAFIVGPGSGSDWTPRLTSFLTAAADAGMGHVVLLSARGVEFHPEGIVAASERTLRDGPVPWTILRPSHFSQNFTEAMFVPVDGAVVAPVGTGAEPFIDVLDIAAVAAEVLIGDGYHGEVLELSGPEALTFDEAVAVLNSRSGRDDVFRDEDRAVHVERLRNGGTPEPYVLWRVAMLDGIRDGLDSRVSDGVPRVLGRTATSFTEWAARDIDAP